MKKERIKVKLGDISNSRNMNSWEDYCQKYGCSFYCLNEGADRNEMVSIELFDAYKWKVINND